MSTLPSFSLSPMFFFQKQNELSPFINLFFPFYSKFYLCLFRVSTSTNYSFHFYLVVLQYYFQYSDTNYFFQSTPFPQRKSGTSHSLLTRSVYISLKVHMVIIFLVFLFCRSSWAQSIISTYHTIDITWELIAEMVFPAFTLDPNIFINLQKHSFIFSWFCHAVLFLGIYTHLHFPAIFFPSGNSMPTECINFPLLISITAHFSVLN